MLKTNEKKIVEVFVECKPGQPWARRAPEVGHSGNAVSLPNIGGITLNVQAGDSAFGWEADHLEPGVSCSANSARPNDFPNNSLQFYSCAGNSATILSGKSKGARGVVLGHHGGSEHVIVDFAPAVKAKMTYDDKIQILAKGQGLKLIDYPEIKIYNLDPTLLKKMKIRSLKNGKLSIPVTTLVPSECMGSGLGSTNPCAGDYDIMTSDPHSVKKYKLDNICFGDFVALLDQDNSYGPTYRRGAITIGIVIHSDCFFSGHGPGVTPLITCARSLIEPVLDPRASIAHSLKIGTQRGKK